MKSRNRNSFAVAALLFGTTWQAQAAFTKVDDFNARTVGNINAQGTWVASDTTCAVVMVDPGNPINKILRHSGAGDAGVTLPAPIANGTTGTFFIRVKRVSTSNDTSFGLSDVAATAGAVGNFANYEAQPNISNLILRGRDAASVQNVVPSMLATAWYKVWVVVDNTADSYKMYVQSDDDATYATQKEFLPTDGVWNFRNGVAANAMIAAQFTSNSSSTSIYFDDLYLDAAAANLTDPTFIANPDTDGDGMNDAWEVFYFGSLSHDGTGDSEAVPDGLTDLQEYQHQTNPIIADTDGDGLSDGAEVSGSANAAFGNAPTNPLKSDTDGDGVTDGQEVNGTLNPAFANAPTNPNAPDSDGDGFTDADEFVYTSDPNSSGSTPRVYVLIGPSKRNGGFELLDGVAGSTVNYDDGWDIAGHDVDNWFQWSYGTVFDKGGSQYQYPAEGTRSGMFDLGVGAFNMTTHMVKAGEIIELKWNHTQDSDLHTGYLVYGPTGTKVTDTANPAGIPGTFLASAGPGLLNRFIYKVPTGSPLIGQTLGVAFLGTSGAGSKVDNVYLTVSEVDSDGDGLSDYWEDKYFGNNDDNPTPAELALQGGAGDPDHDGYTNLDEQAYGSNPALASSNPGDTDGDGLADAWEIANFGSITAQNGAGDPDNDFATNLQEYNGGVDSTNPNSAISWPDTDADGLNDGWEMHYFGNLTQTATGDPDADGSDNLAEMTAGSDPTNGAWTATRAKLAHRWSFNGSLSDSVGTSNATIVDPDANPAVGGTATLSATGITLAGGASASSEYVSLGTNLLNGRMTPVTIELWATQNSVMNQGRIFDFGNGTNEYLYMSWTDGTNLNSDAIAWKDPTQVLIAGTNAPYTLGTKFHLVVTLVPAFNSAGGIASGTRVTWFAAPAGTGGPQWSARGGFTTPYSLVTLSDVNDWLGHSQWAADSAANATYDEVRIWDGALTETERELFQVAGPDVISFADADGDGLFDAWETAYFGNLDQTAAGDPDGDGATNLAEQTAHSNPTLALSVPGDTDGDGLADSWETTYFNNLSRSGTDDPDGDYNTNEAEETAGTIPTSAASWPDADGDGLNDGWEVHYFGNLTAQNATGDPDGDTFDNLAEQTAGSDPTNGLSSPDSDFDALADGWELRYFILPGENKVTDFATIIGRYNGAADPDNDGATNRAEQAAGTNPMLATSVPDLNGDGIPDGNILVAGDALGTTSFNTGLNWDNSLAPVAGKNYLVAVNGLRTPTAGDVVFAGDKLVLTTVGANVGSLILKTTGAVTIPYLGLDGAFINQAAAAAAVVLNGTVNVTKTSEIGTSNGDFTMAATVTGTGNLNITKGTGGGSRTVTFSGPNTWTGTLNVIDTNLFTLGATGNFRFKPGASGVTNAITGAGSAILNGSFTIDTSAASTAPGASWTLVSIAAKTYGATFTVAGYTPDGAAVGSRKWKAGTFQFDEATSTLSVLPGYSAWISGFFANPADQAADADPDHDGLSNLLEYAIDGMVPNAANGAPGTIAGKSVTFTKRALAAANGDVIYGIEESSDLGVADAWAGVTPTVNNSTIISYTFPAGSPPKDFVRLKVTK